MRIEPPRQLLCEDSVDDERHDLRLGRLELVDLAAVVVHAFAAAEARIDEIIESRRLPSTRYLPAGALPVCSYRCADAEDERLSEPGRRGDHPSADAASSESVSMSWATTPG